MIFNCGESVTGPNATVSPSPLPTPSPSPSPVPVRYDTTFIFRADSPTNYAWALGIVPTLEAEQTCSQDNLPIECPNNPGIWTWFFSGSAFCLPQGNPFSPTLRVQCYSPGILDVTVTPPKGPQGRSIFKVQPGE